MHEPHDNLGAGESGQGRFIGYLGLGLLALMVVFTIAVLGAAARMGFS